MRGSLPTVMCGFKLPKQPSGLNCELNLNREKSCLCDRALGYMWILAMKVERASLRLLSRLGA